MNEIALLFPGQGSQYVGMGKDIYEHYAPARRVFDEANEILGFDLKKMVFEGFQEEITKTENAQPAILTASVAALRVYMQEIGKVPAYCAGHSLGEFTALVSSSAMEFADALRIVRLRGKLMQEAADENTGIMVSISGISKDMVQNECDSISSVERPVVIACYNSPKQIVVSGYKEAVEKLALKLTYKGARTVSLRVGASFHSPMMQSVSDKIFSELKKYKFGKCKWSVISNVTGLPYNEDDDIARMLSLHITRPVRWKESMDFLSLHNISTVIEIGPGTALKKLIKEGNESVTAVSLEKKDDVNKVKELLRSDSLGVCGTDEELELKNSIRTLVIRCLSVAICTRNRNWDNNEYKKGMIEPYREIQEMLKDIEKGGLRPTVEHGEKALEMLKSVFRTKKTPQSEQKERFKQILDEIQHTHLGYFEQYLSSRSLLYA